MNETKQPTASIKPEKNKGKMRIDTMAIVDKAIHQAEEILEKADAMIHRAEEIKPQDPPKPEAKPTAPAPATKVASVGPRQTPGAVVIPAQTDATDAAERRRRYKHVDVSTFYALRKPKH